MATLKPLVWIVLAGCSELQGYGGAPPPLVTFEVVASGDLSSVRSPDETGTPNLRVALVWGRQWLIEPLCILPAENADAAALIAAGCRDPFGFVANRVAANAAITLGQPTSLELFDLPAADVMVGDLTARVAYASVILYDDKDNDGTLTLGRPNRPVDAGRPDTTPVDTKDLAYGASFISMTAPDQRVAFREGAFIQSAFYPRAGCSEPATAFSVLGAGGFSAADAIAATLAGTLPTEDPTTCTNAAPAATRIEFGLQPAAAASELRCTERATDSSVRYREPDVDAPDMTNRVGACVHSPSFGAPSETIEFVISGRSDDSCVGLTHYALRACTESPTCGSPDWDHSANPPPWWPC
ncbi:hypothetical protein BH11MYX1_BH11MYX1_04590 [soil metagenome]